MTSLFAYLECSIIMADKRLLVLHCCFTLDPWLVLFWVLCHWIPEVLPINQGIPGMPQVWWWAWAAHSLLPHVSNPLQVHWITQGAKPFSMSGDLQPWIFILLCSFCIIMKPENAVQLNCADMGRSTLQIELEGSLYVAYFQS